MLDLLKALSLGVARVVFVGALLLVLLASVRWALSPDERPDATQVVAVPEETEAPPDEAGAATPTAAPAPEPTSTEDAPEVLIAAARPPGDTTLQVLDAGGGAARVDRAVAAVEQLGYDVVAINPSSRNVPLTTVYFTDGAEAEARALRARDPRFRVIEPNQGLSEGVDVHILVGADF